MDYRKSGATDYPVVPNQVPTIEECLRAIATGKPLPAGAVQNTPARYNSGVVNNYHVHDDLWHLEQSRRRVERLRDQLEIQAITERARQSSFTNAEQQRSEPKTDAQPSDAVSTK